jgi:Tfp pilus assembly protein PilF
MALAGVRFTQQQFAAARELYNRVLDLEPSNLMARRNLAELNVAQDQPFAALEQFRSLNSEQETESGTNNPELVNRIQRLEVDILRRRGFQPYWERY